MKKSEFSQKFKEEVVEYIRSLSDQGERDQDIAYAVSSKFGLLLTRCEVKDMNRSGW